MTQSFGDWLHDLRDKRERWVAVSHENKFDRGIWNATVEKYADPSHFIFELLQNAEDAGATCASFRLQPNAVIFEHDGRPFERSDIEGITGIGNTTKPDEANKIGCFGIGFKSVYVLTERPEVHCTIEGTPVAFAIRDLVVPELIEVTHFESTTRFVLPLSSPNSTETITKLRTVLEQAGPRSLLFLRQLRRLDWTVGSIAGSCIAHDDRVTGVRSLQSTSNDREDRTDRFLVLSRPVRREGESTDLAVKIALHVNDGGDIAPTPIATRLSVYFETEEQTGLYMHLHGPFQLTDNRANIKRDNAWNSLLVDELSILLAESLPHLRDRGLIKRSFLDVLPNTTDELLEPWGRLRDAAVGAFRTHALVPAQFGGHIYARAAVRGPADIRDLLGDKGLAAFGGVADCRWAVGGMLRNSRTDAFLSSLGIADWGAAELLAAFQRALGPTYYNSNVAAMHTACTWFDALDDDQVQRLYLQVDASIRGQKRTTSLAHVSFVRIEDGRRVRPAEALLPPTSAPLDAEAAAHGLVLVRSTLVRSSRGRGKEVEQFLRGQGVKEIGERDYLLAILRANYAPGARAPNVEHHLQHMRRFLRWHTEHSDDMLFAGVAFLRVERDDGYHTPSTVYLGQHYATNGLSLIYDGTIKGRDRRSLWRGYDRLKRTDLLAFVKRTGVEDALAVYRTDIPRGHPNRHELTQGFGSARVTDSGQNTDYTIPQLSDLVARSNPEISKLIWRAIATTGAHVMQASYAPNQTYEPHRAPSTLALCLRDAEWIPALDGSLRRPCAITVPELGAGLSITGNEAWLHAIGFAADHRRRSEQHQTRRRAAQLMGLPEELADQLATLPPDALKAFGSEMLRRVASGAFTAPEFPERESSNPERRAARMAERTRAAPSKSYEVHDRSVRISDKEARRQARPYLTDLYTNSADEMICQACHQEMPFRLGDGSPYFEAPELLADASSELVENHLALCPTCSAKWRFARTTTDAELLEKLRDAKAPEMNVSLAGEETVLRFVQVHFDDLRTIAEIISDHTASFAETGSGD